VIIFGIILLILLIATLKYLNYTNKLVKNMGYYVFCPQGREPRVVHWSFETAYREAVRLHFKHPYNDFLILKIEHLIRKQNINDDEIPF